MVDFFVNTEQGEIGLEEYGKLLERFPQFAERAVASALSSEGYHLQQEIKRTIQTGGASVGWPQLNPHTGILNKRKKGTIKNYSKSRKGVKKGGEAKKRFWDVKLSTKLNPLSRFAGATRYKYYPDVNTVEIGFLNSRGQLLNMNFEARRQATGYKTHVTPKMRELAFAMGFPLKKETTELITPPRPVIGPIFRREQAGIRSRFQQKVMNNIVRYAKGLYRFTSEERPV